MIIEVIRDVEGLENVRAEWDAVYAADPEAHFFLSWGWLADWFAVEPAIWLVLVARPGEGAAALGFLPLRNRLKFESGRRFFNEISFGGAEFADYCGLLAHADHEDAVVAAFGRHLSESMFWGKLRLENFLMSDRRRQLLLSALTATRFHQTDITYRADGVDHAICPYVSLPSDWDRYLETLSANNRQKIRRFLRRVDAGGDDRVELSGSDVIQRDLGALLELWKIKWRPSKGDEADTIATRNLKMLGRCAERGMLLLPTYWHGDRMVAALGVLVDEVKKSLLFMIAGRDETYGDAPTGYILHAFMIRYAIANGFKEYDFLRGDESYKFLFARETRILNAFSLDTRNGANLGDRIHPSWARRMLSMAGDLQKTAAPAEVDVAYAQILEVDPDNALAAYRYGTVKAGRGEHAEAAHLFKRSVELEPTGDNAWLALAGSLQMLGETEDALRACRRAVAVAPDNQAARTLLLELTSAAGPRAVDWRLHAPVSLDQPVVQPRSDPLAALRRQSIRAVPRRR
jgi:CelD/BcsL family acetyltransferase involved in cellulose biosynthesis